jgi:hypothetical protein
MDAMTQSTLSFILSCIAFLAGADFSQAHQEKKLPIPEDAAQKEAEKTIRALFKEEYAKRAPADRIALAKNLLKQGFDTKDDAAARFVLYREAQEIAGRAGDLETAFRAIDEMSTAYETNPIALKQAVLVQASAVPRTPEELRALAQASLALSDEAMQTRQFEVAAKASQGAVAAAKKLKDIPLLSKSEAQSKASAAILEKFEKARKAIEALQVNPENADANQAAGEFECFALGDWKSGLPKLAKGTDASLKALAARDLARPAETAEQVAVGDGWWDRAEKENGHPKTMIRLRAGHWYRLATQHLSGLTKAKLEKRLEEIAAGPGAPMYGPNRIPPPGAPGSIDLTTLKAKKAAAAHGGLGFNSSDTGEVPSVAGKECKTYIFAHAPSNLIYEIPAGTRFFLATGVRRAPRVEGSWKYMVTVDGKMLWESKSLTTYEGFEVEIAVALPPGAKEIQLSTDTLGSDNGDHCVWAYPRFQK